MSRLVLALLAVVALAGGCSPPHSDAPPVAASAPPADPVARTRQERTAEVVVEMGAATPPGARPFLLTGAMALDGSASVLRFDARDLGIPVDGPSDGEYRSVGSRTWLRPPPVLLPLPTGKRWVELSPGANLGLLSLLARPPALDAPDREVDRQGRIRSLRRVDRKPGAPDLLTVVRLRRFGVPVSVVSPPPEEVVAATDL